MSGAVPQRLIEAYATGELNPDDRLRVEAYLQTSPADAAAVRRLQTIVRALRTDADGPSRALIDAAIQIQRPRSPGILEQLLGNLRATLAALVHDSRAAPALAGFRSVQEGVELAYSSDVAEIEMRCEPIVTAGIEKWRVVGQVTLVAGATGDLVLQFAPDEGDAGSIDVPIDAAGMFSTDLDGGRYDVLLRAGDQAVVIPELEL